MPLCEFSMLEESGCAHCTGRTATVVGIQALEAATRRPLPQYRARPRQIPRGEHGGRPSPTWSAWTGDHDRPKACWCDHPHPDGGICTDCALQLRLVLQDIPQLSAELETAIRRETAFAERGTRLDGDPDEAALAWAVAQDDPASKALAELHRTLVHPDGTARVLWAVDTTAGWMLRVWPDLLRRDDIRELCGTITGAAARCRRVIDRPRDLVFLGACPLCDAQARATNLIAERDADTITCPHPDCTYTATRAQHIQQCVDAGEDRWLTIDELVGAITTSGGIVSRSQILRWYEREGLASESRPVPRWRDGVVVSENVRVYRLGDIRERADQAELEARSYSAATAAAELDISPSHLRNLVEKGILAPMRRSVKPHRFARRDVEILKVKRASA